MRILSIAMTIILVIIGVVFTVLPMGILAFIPVGGALLMSIVTIILSKCKKKNLPKYLLLASFIAFLAVVSKDVFVKKQFVVDQQLDTNKEESRQEAKKD